MSFLNVTSMDFMVWPQSWSGWENRSSGEKKFPARRWLCMACLNMRNWDGKFENIFNIFNVLFSFLWRIFELISFVAMALREFHLYFVI